MNDKAKANHVRKIINQWVRDDLQSAKEYIERASNETDADIAMHYLSLAVGMFMRAYCNREGTRACVGEPEPPIEYPIENRWDWIYNNPE